MGKLIILMVCSVIMSILSGIVFCNILEDIDIKGIALFIFTIFLSLFFFFFFFFFLFGIGFDQYRSVCNKCGSVYTDQNSIYCEKDGERLEIKWGNIGDE